MKLDFELLYDIYTQDFISLVQGEDFYTEFMNKAKSGNSEVSYTHRFIDKQIDLRWVEAIEEAIIPLDNIIRNPRRFIVQEEEIVNIELARKISPESIRHLAQHTNMIAKVEDDTVTPNKILNIFKEESFGSCSATVSAGVVSVVFSSVTSSSFSKRHPTNVTASIERHSNHTSPLFIICFMTDILPLRYQVIL